MPTHLLSRARQRAKAALHLHPDMTLSLARVHEACGPARYSFALWLASRTEGPVLWIAPAWDTEFLDPTGLSAFADPARFLFAKPQQADDLLWVMEEALRSGAVPLVVAELPALPGLTPVRRLHLAAETGSGIGRPSPLGLVLTPGDGGAQGPETRWHMRADFQDGQQSWSLERRRARTQPLRAWHVTRSDSGMQIAPA